MTYVLRIDHPVPDYDTWRREGFDRDPIGRAEHGVRRYRILRDGRDVVIELEFDTRPAAEAFEMALAGLWRGVMDRFAWSELPATGIYELAGTGDYNV